MVFVMDDLIGIRMVSLPQPPPIIIPETPLEYKGFMIVRTPIEARAFMRVRVPIEAKTYMLAKVKEMEKPRMLVTVPIKRYMYVKISKIKE